MSALDVQKRHREYQCEHGPFSESFSTEYLSFKGVFDFSPANENSDGGNVQQKNRKPRIMVATIPDGLEPDIEITRDGTGEIFRFHFSGVDAEGVSYVWMY